MLLAIERPQNVACKIRNMAKRTKMQPGARLDAPEIWSVEPGVALGGFRLGMPRADVFQSLTAMRFETDGFFEDDEFYLIEMETTLFFGTDPPNPLVLIEVSDDRARFGSLKVLGDYPHNIFSSIPSNRTLWFDHLPSLFGSIEPANSKALPTDRDLLDQSILWIKDLGVGFGLAGGKIISIYLCDPSDLPELGNGEFTGAQRHLSEKMQIASFRSGGVKSRPLERAIKAGMLLVAVAVASLFGRQAWQEQKRWDESPEVQAEVVAVSPPPPEPFPEKFQLIYRDHLGEIHRADLDANQVYGVPKVGEKVSLRYLRESPKDYMGPVEIHDVGFNLFVPYLIGTVAVYLLFHIIVDSLALLRPRKSRNQA